MAFFDGAVSYTEITNMPLLELFRLNKVANEISRDRKLELERSKRGK